MRAFQYKVDHSALTLNQKMFFFHKVASPLRTFRNKEEKTITLFFPVLCQLYCGKKLETVLLNIFELPDLIPESGIFSFLNLIH